MKRQSCLVWLLAAVVMGTGCRDTGSSKLLSQAQNEKTKVVRKVRQPVPKPRKPDVSAELDIIAQAHRETQSRTRFMGRAEEVAVKQVAGGVTASLELGPTLVVWIVDRTPSAQTLVSQSLPAILDFYESAETREAAAGEGQPLLSAVVAFDDTAEFVLDPPSPDLKQTIAALENIRASTGGTEKTFAAIEQALAKYLAVRTSERREVLFVVITDEAGSDPQLVENLLETTRRNALPVYVIGYAAPWGQVNPFAPDPKTGDKTKTDDTSPAYGPESLFSERVDIQGWVAATSYSPGFQARPSFDQIDSGFGPFALERLCRASQGKFLAVRRESSGSGGGFRMRRGVSDQYWPTGEEIQFDLAVVARYAPDYVSEADYRQLLAENKARQALHEAAKLPRLAVEDSPDTNFPKGNDAEMARRLSRAQQFAAQHLPTVERYFTVLSPGEADRDRLSGPRWQAQFDLAMGQVLALKARLDGYNSMIAALKRGKSFQNESSTTWVLEPAETFETESSIRKLAERAKVYLDRVVKEHPGTPWARIAEEELKTPLGWTWKET